METDSMGFSFQDSSFLPEAAPEFEASTAPTTSPSAYVDDPFISKGSNVVPRTTEMTRAFEMVRQDAKNKAEAASDWFKRGKIELSTKNGELKAKIEELEAENQRGLRAAPRRRGGLHRLRALRAHPLPTRLVLARLAPGVLSTDNGREGKMENESQRERVEDGQGGDSDSDGTMGIFVKRTCPVHPEDAGETGTEHDNSGSNADTSKEKSAWRYQLSFEQIVEGMRRLNINVDETALTEAFARLRIQAPTPQAPRKNGNPFLDDSD